MMIGTGVLANTAAVVVGGLIGLLLKKGVPKQLNETLMKALGCCCIFMGIAGALTGLLTVKNGTLTTTGTMLMIASLILGTVIGELCRIEHWINRFGEFLKRKVHAERDSRFIDGFMTNVLVICVGAMAIVGSFQDGMAGDPSTLYIKAIMDGIITMIFASTLGVGAVFAAIPLFLYQGILTFGSSLIAPFLTEAIISDISWVGSILIFVVGLNLTFDNLRIRVGNMVPALLIPVIYGFLPF